MSRQLPTRPSLEYLKKQAKVLLEELQRHDASARLADAQHALARGYGFASWPKLKAHVELAARTPPAPSPFAGEWRTDIARSQRHPANEFQRATIVFEVDGEDVRITDVVVDEAGRVERRVNAVRADGLEHVPASGRGYSLIATWRDSYTLETVGKKDGEIVGGATYAVSADDRTLTITADRQRLVLHRTPTRAVPTT
jgi:hypothetical protein